MVLDVGVGYLFVVILWKDDRVAETRCRSWHREASCGEVGCIILMHEELERVGMLQSGGIISL